ncbi:hypothetical protein LEP1GSC008_4006 [Leptospira kirschneri serovar Bulgarica str. Nikolaevo]|uniref:Uncharacterized protein n=1 Tax=Leptospira kirschneri serovar Bulgarica str. Nikolaevo TaxID=1240687 RepID=M6F3B9_9LEPT|nr:hypothetical protein LEP1GSC008_4006 [Leptospira kirschneri serovar Bulgarica str. Nikolaevo]
MLQCIEQLVGSKKLSLVESGLPQAAGPNSQLRSSYCETTESDSIFIKYQ